MHLEHRLEQQQLQHETEIHDIFMMLQGLFDGNIHRVRDMTPFPMLVVRLLICLSYGMRLITTLMRYIASWMVQSRVTRPTQLQRSEYAGRTVLVKKL